MSRDVVVAALPGEAVEDQHLIAQAIDHINDVYVAKGLETALAIGEYVLSGFFGGDPEAFRRKGRKHVSFRKLAETDALLVSHSFLWNAVAVVEQYRLLPEPLAQALPFSHHRALLPVRDAKLKVRLAKEAQERGFTKRMLEAEVRKARKKELGDSTRGRPPLPAFVKGINRIRKGIAAARSEDLSLQTFAHYRPEDARSLLTELEADLESLTGLLAQVRSTLDEFEVSVREIADGGGEG